MHSWYAWYAWFAQTWKRFGRERPFSGGFIFHTADTPWSCDRELESVLSTAWKRNRSDSTRRSQMCQSWMSWRIGRTRGTCSENKNTIYHWSIWAQAVVVILCFQMKKKTGRKGAIDIDGEDEIPTQCFLSTSSSASHFRVRNGCFSLMISPSKKVT